MIVGWTTRAQPSILEVNSLDGVPYGGANNFETMSNFSMVKNKFIQGNGTVSIGSITEGDNFQPKGWAQYEVIYTLFDTTSSPGTVQDIKSYRLHDYINGYIVDIAPFKSNEPIILVTFCGRANASSHYGINYLVLDVGDFNSAPSLITNKFYSHPNGHNFYPYSTVYNEERGIIYTCGHADDLAGSPISWPNIHTDKSAFIARTDANTWAVDFKLYNTQSSAAGSDYDMFNKLYLKNGSLVALGAANWTFGSYPSSIIRISNFDLSPSMTLINSEYIDYGTPGLLGSNVDEFGVGIFAGNLIDDHANPGTYFLTFQVIADQYEKTGMLHLESDFTRSLTSPNSFIFQPDPDEVYYSERIGNTHYLHDPTSSPANKYCMTTKRSTTNPNGGKVQPAYNIYEWNFDPVTYSLSANFIEGFAQLNQNPYMFNEINDNWQLHLPYWTHPATEVQFDKEFIRTDHWFANQTHPNDLLNYPKIMHTWFNGDNDCPGGFPIINEPMPRELINVDYPSLEDTLNGTFNTWPFYSTLPGFQSNHCSNGSGYRYSADDLNKLKESQQSGITIFNERSEIKLETSVSGNYQIFDMQGRLILQGKCTEGKQAIPHNLSSGIYIIKTSGKNNVTNTKKFYVD